ncbi:hypothetical protein ABW636_07150 [Aquimarina sp. 2201CG1-2-11]|uniref:hypothetical protein n=1 Tax=Aquimarina discodermiae TaxID=3231043 RepID=UPI003461ECA0
MKNYLLLFLFMLPAFAVNANYSLKISPVSFIESSVQNPSDRKLSTEEVKQRGLDLLANQIVANLDDIDLRKMARSAIFETSYGFRWKMVNLHNGQKIIIKVDKDFNLISARSSDNSKIMTP